MQQDAPVPGIKGTAKKMRKMDKVQNEERETQPELSPKEAPVGTARQRTTTISGNSTKPPKTNPKKNSHARSDNKI
jgi:hypothetical protein